MEMLLILLLGLSALRGTDEVNPCLDPTDDASYSCELSDDLFGRSHLSFESCGIGDEDFDDLVSCLDAAGRQEIVLVDLTNNYLTTLPEGIFGGLTSLEDLDLTNNYLTTLPEGIFEGLTSLDSRLYLDHNNLTILPKGIFEGLTFLNTMYLSYNSLTTLPEGIFDGLTNLVALSLRGNNLECLPTVPSFLADFAVDPYGDECGCSIADVTDNVCGQEACTPGSVGYTCGDGVMDENDDRAAVGATLAPTSEEGTADAEVSGNRAMSAFSLPAGSVYAGVLGVAMAAGGMLVL